MLSIKLFSVLDKDPCGSIVFERYVVVSNSEVRVGKINLIVKLFSGLFIVEQKESFQKGEIFP